MRNKVWWGFVRKGGKREKRRQRMRRRSRRGEKKKEDMEGRKERKRKGNINEGLIRCWVVPSPRNGSTLTTKAKILEEL